MKDLSNEELGKLLDRWGRDLAKAGLLGSHCPICEGLNSNPNVKICPDCQKKFEYAGDVEVELVKKVCYN